MHHAFAARLVTATLALMLLIVAGRVAHAQSSNVRKLIKDLKTSSDYKVRLSAAASLTKLGDPAAVPAFIEALENDDEKTVRAAVAIGLGKLVTGSTSEQVVASAIAALEGAGTDPDKLVRNQAKKSLDKLRKLAGGGAAVGAGSIYIDLGDMSAKIKEDAAAMKALMRSTTEKTFGKNASGMVTKWPGGKAPSKKQLKNVQAFHVDGTINELSTKSKGSATIVSCKVNMLIATYPEKSMFGFLNGGASVQASDSPSDIELAKKDCVAAVVEDLVIKKIIPTIEAKAGQ